MDKLKQFYLKKRIAILSITMLCITEVILGQVNCFALFEKDSPEYCACMLIYGGRTEGKARYQGAKESQALCDSAISLFPTFADPYYTKAIPFLKRGEFELWKTIIDKAVEYDTLAYLGYRAGAHFMFLRNYEEAINDIETLQFVTGWDDLGTIYNGEYDLEVIRALSYRGLCDTIKAIEILENHIKKTNDAGLWGYYHLGVMYFQQKRYDDAKQALMKQLLNNEIADAYYYLGLIYEIEKNIEFENAIRTAYELYLSGKRIRGNNSFMDYPDKIYFSQIKEAMRIAIL